MKIEEIKKWIDECMTRLKNEQKKKKLRNWLTDEWLNTTPITLAASIWGWRQQAQSDWRRDGEKTDE